MIPGVAVAAVCGGAGARHRGRRSRRLGRGRRGVGLGRFVGATGAQGAENRITGFAEEKLLKKENINLKISTSQRNLIFIWKKKKYSFRKNYKENLF